MAARPGSRCCRWSAFSVRARGRVAIFLLFYFHDERRPELHDRDRRLPRRHVRRSARSGGRSRARCAAARASTSSSRTSRSRPTDEDVLATPGSRRLPACAICFVTDIHGSERCFRKFLNAGKFYDVAVSGARWGHHRQDTGPDRARGPAAGARASATTSTRDMTRRERDELEQLIRDNGQYPVIGERDELLALVLGRAPRRDVPTGRRREHRALGRARRGAARRNRRPLLRHARETTTSGRSTRRCTRLERGRVRRGPVRAARRSPRDDHDRLLEHHAVGLAARARRRTRSRERIEAMYAQVEDPDEPDRGAPPAALRHRARPGAR